MKQLGKVVIGFIGITLLGLTTLLIIEYRFFHDQAQKMLELKEEYRTYTLAIKKVLNEYNAMRDQAAADAEYTASLDSAEQKDSFMVVNREPNYLKQSMINYIRKENLEFILKSIDHNEWTDYTDQIKRKTTRTITANKKRTKRKRHNSLQALKFPSETYHLIPTKDINFIWPIDRSQFWLSSFFGPRRKPNHTWGFHYGIDMASCRGTPVLAAADGVVLEARFDTGYGNTVLISHTTKYKTRYAHLDKILVNEGQKINQGTPIGKVGSTGAVFKKKGKDPSHLHFEVYANGKKVNPLSFFV